MDFNLIIIGGGPGGYKTATYAASKGLTVLVVEKDELGGTCLNRGCIPTKTYARLAEVIETMKDAESYALDGVTYNLISPRLSPASSRWWRLCAEASPHYCRFQA